MINNRQQSGRRRGRGGQRQGGGAPGGPNGGNRIDNRARGNANQLYEKYKNMAADAQRQGDRVQTEYYLQFADHYFRVLAETRPRFEEQQRQAREREERFDDELDGDGEDYGDEGDAIRPGEQSQPRMNGDRGGDDRQFNDRQGGDRQFNDRQAGDRQGGERNDRRRFDGPRDGPRDGQRDGQRDRPRRDEEDRRPQASQPRDDDRRPRRDDRRERFGENRANGEAQPGPASAAQPFEATDVEPSLPMPEPEAAQPRRRGRPRREEAPAEAPAFDADRLPPALGAPANDAGDEPKPRRRRTRVVEAPAPAAE